MMSQPGSPAAPGTDAALVCLAAAGSVSGLCWAAAAASATLSGHRPPRWRPLAGAAAFTQAGDPARAWGTPVGPAPLYWTMVALLMGVAVTAAWGAWLLHKATSQDRLEIRRRVEEGMATRSEAREAAGARALPARDGRLRAELARPRACDVGYRLEPPAVTAARVAAQDAEARIKRHLQVLDTGLNLALGVERTQAAQARANVSASTGTT